MADNTQLGTTLLAHQAHTHSLTDVSIVGSEVDVRTNISAGLWVYHANVEVIANAEGVRYILQGRWSTASGLDEDWVDILTVLETGVTAAVAAEISGSEAVGETTIAVDADPTAAFTRGVPCYLRDNSVVADGEWGRVSHSAAAADIVTLVDGLTIAKDAADNMWTQAESRYVSDIPLGNVSWIRMIVLHSALTGSNIQFKAELVEVTDFA